jgi:hypothetical protein
MTQRIGVPRRRVGPRLDTALVTALPSTGHAQAGRLSRDGLHMSTVHLAAPRDTTAAGTGPTQGFLAYAVRRDAAGKLRLAPAWPLWALLVLFPVWWALGLGSFIFVLLAIPMAVQLWRRRPLRLPPAFWLWALFLLWTLLSLAMYFDSPAHTTAGTGTGRLIATLVGLAEYAAATVTLLFIGNLGPAELPQGRLVRWLGVLFLVTVAGGFLGTYFPRFAFTSPLEMMVSPNLRSDPYISALIHPNAAQLQAIIGGESGRAAAPWGYTNYWANNFSLLLIWFVVGWGIGTSPRRKVICWLIVAASSVPIVYSLNRGLWIGLALTVLLIAVRLLLHGKILVLASVIAVFTIGAGAFAFTPLQDVYGSRLQHPSSNAIRLFLTKAAINGANESPVLGWGGTRRTVGSNRSIAIGKTPDCPLCGQFAIGSNGQLWTVLFNQGYLGAAFFLGFFGVTVWTYRRDKSVVSQAGVIAVALTFIYMLFYSSLPSALTITMISVALLWRARLDEPAPRIPSVAAAW